MSSRLRIDRFVWDAWNVDHIAKHAVQPEEAEEVVAGRPIAYATYKGRIQVIGPTRTGRMLTVIAGEDPNANGVFYVFSARPASRKERRRYEQEHERGALGEQPQADR